MFTEATGLAGFQVLVNPGDLLCCHGHGGDSGSDPVAQLLRPFEPTLQSLGALRRFRSLFPVLRDPFRLAFKDADERRWELMTDIWQGWRI